MQARRDEGWTRTDAGKGDDDDDGGADASDDFNIIYILSAGITSALFIHYVPLLHNFSDLQVKIKYCDDNPLVCQNISSTATKFMLPFSTRSNIFSLGARILEAFLIEMKGLGVF